MTMHSTDYNDETLLISIDDNGVGSALIIMMKIVVDED